MKRKMIERSVPVKPKRKGEYITTVQMVEDILVLNVYVKGVLKGRHAINPQTGEYAQCQKDGWKVWKYGNLLGLDMTSYGWYSSQDQKERTVFDTREQEKIVREALKMSKKIAYNPNTFDLIDEAEREYQRKKHEKTESNRMMRVKDKMDLVPELPENIREWIWQQEGEEDFVFFDKKAGKWHCSNCRQNYEEKDLKRADGEKKIRHNDLVICPQCQKTILAKKRVAQIEKKTHFSLLQKMDDRMSVMRHFDVKMYWSGAGRKVWINEAMRVVMNHFSYHQKYCSVIYYNQFGTEELCKDSEYAYFDNKGNLANRRSFAGCLYPEGIEEALNDTVYQAWGSLFSQMAAAGKKLNYNRLLSAQNNTNLISMVECLFKGRFNRLLYETAENVSYWDGGHYGVLYTGGERIEDTFGIPDRQLINRIRDVDGGSEMVRWMRWSYKNKQKISQELLSWLSKNQISQEDVKFIHKKMSLQQIMNYVTRQQSEEYRSITAKAVLNQWADYLDMLKNLGKKTNDEMMYRPRELKRRHDECVEEINRQRVIQEMERNAEQRAAEAKRMRERFPGAEEVLEEIRTRYEYSNDQYIIIVPKNLIEIITEGQALHHCAGSSDRYFDRIMQRETYICFLRKVSDPETPYYTIEVEPGGTIRQHRGMFDHEPDIKKLKPFLREWQKEIRKRMTKEDHEYAKVSAVKRAANIEELKAKNNQRVLNGLMEDFMEAI